MTALLDTPVDLIAISPETRELVFDAHTAFTFSPAPVSDEQIEAIYDLVKHAPTAFNVQTLRLISVKSPEARERLVSHMMDGNKAKTATAPVTLIVAADTEFHENLPRTFPVFPGAKDLFTEPEGREQFARNMTWLQMGYLILGIRAAGLAAGPMTGFDNAGVDNDLLAGTNLKSIAVINVGQPGEDAFYPRNPRLDVDEVITVL